MNQVLNTHKIEYVGIKMKLEEIVCEIAVVFHYFYEALFVFNTTVVLPCE